MEFAIGGDLEGDDIIEVEREVEAHKIIEELLTCETSYQSGGHITKSPESCGVLLKQVYLSEFPQDPFLDQLKSLGVKPHQACSALCLHPWQKFVKPGEGFDDEDDNNEEVDTPMVNVLRTRISAKTASVEAFQRLVNDMRENGRSWKGEIVREEKKVYTNVSRDLERGMAYVVGAQARKNQHKLRMDAAQKEQESLQLDIDAELQVLEEAVEAVERKSVEQDNDLHALRTYKDKLYPVQLLQINKLTNELNSIDDKHKVDDKKLQLIVLEEMTSLKEQQHVTASHIVGKIAERTFAKSRPRVIIMLNKNNKILSKEINQQKKDIAVLEKEIERLQNENNEIIRSKVNDVRSVAFKDVFHQRDKIFGPDDDVILDIPLPVVLPI